MGKKGKSIIRELLNRIKWSEDSSKYIVKIIHRGFQGEYGTIEIKASRIDDVGSWYFSIGETIIPFHRIIEVRNISGKVVWRKGDKSYKM